MRSRRKKKRQKKGLPIIIFVVIVVCLCVGVKVHSLKKQSTELAERQEALTRQIESEEERTKELEETDKYMQTKKFAEEVAKEKLGLVYPDEILIEPNNK